MDPRQLSMISIKLIYYLIGAVGLRSKGPYQKKKKKKEKKI